MRKIILIFCVGLLMACNKDETPVILTITNGSFEQNGSFSTEGWVVSNGTSSSDAPTAGGSFALRLDPAEVPGEGYAETVIEDLEGTLSLTISGYIKSFGAWPGSITIKKRNADNQVTVLATEYSSDAEWQQKTFQINQTFTAGDALIIKLSAGSTEAPVDTKYVLFDLFGLTQN